MICSIKGIVRITSHSRFRVPATSVLYYASSCYAAHPDAGVCPETPQAVRLFFAARARRLGARGSMPLQMNLILYYFYIYSPPVVVYFRIQHNS
jgi:hypothetical protein